MKTFTTAYTSLNASPNDTWLSLNRRAEDFSPPSVTTDRVYDTRYRTALPAVLTVNKLNRHAGYNIVNTTLNLTKPHSTYARALDISPSLCTIVPNLVTAKQQIASYLLYTCIATYKQIGDIIEHVHHMMDLSTEALSNIHIVYGEPQDPSNAHASCMFCTRMDNTRYCDFQFTVDTKLRHHYDVSSNIDAAPVFKNLLFAAELNKTILLLAVGTKNVYEAFDIALNKDIDGIIEALSASLEMRIVAIESYAKGHGMNPAPVDRAYSVIQVPTGIDSDETSDKTFRLITQKRSNLKQEIYSSIFENVPQETTDVK